MPEKREYAVHLVKPQRLFALLQFSYEPQSYPGPICKFLLCKPKRLTPFLYKINQRFHKFIPIGCHF